MARRLLAAVSLGALVALVVACNALNGAGDLAVCEGVACVELGTDVPIRDPNGVDGALASDGSAPLPDVCTNGQKACEGRTAATCVGTGWNRTPCAEQCVDGACIAWPSCRNAAGAGCATTRSCCETSAVPAGTFDRRNDSTTPATISAFSLESFEVTVGRFRAFVAAGGGTSTSPPPAGAGAHPKLPGSGWQATWNTLLPADAAALKASLQGGTWTEPAASNERKPITRVSWMLAFAFCAADGARLPTNAEWSYASAGGSEQRVYPWSSPPTSTFVSSNIAAYSCAFTAPALSCPPSVCSAGGASPCNVLQCQSLGGTCSSPPCSGCDANADIAPVGSLPAGLGRFGHFDLGGNASELVLDAIDYKGRGDKLVTPCVDCAVLMPQLPLSASKDLEVYLMGGDWNGAGANLRNDLYSTRRFNETSPQGGFRCARD